MVDHAIQRQGLRAVPWDEDDEEMTLDQIRWIRRFRTGGETSTELKLDPIPILINDDSRQSRE
jgi:hypothetical protein